MTLYISVTYIGFIMLKIKYRFLLLKCLDALRDDIGHFNNLYRFHYVENNKASLKYNTGNHCLKTVNNREIGLFRESF